VAHVEDGGAAAAAGLQAGDLIVAIDGKVVAGVRDAVRLLSQERDSGHLVLVRRGGGALFLLVPA
jgi:serine protease Do